MGIKKIKFFHKEYLSPAHAIMGMRPMIACPWAIMGMLYLNLIKKCLYKPPFDFLFFYIVDIDALIGYTTFHFSVLSCIAYDLFSIRVATML